MTRHVLQKLKPISCQLRNMSVILITEHNENIYNVVQKVEARYKKSPRFIPKVRKRIEKQLQEESSGRKLYGVMGLPEQPLPDPSKYLRRKEGLKQLKKSASPGQDDDGGKAQLKNPLPTEEELREFRKKWKKPVERNFINVNVKAVVHQKPKTPTKQLVLDCFGNKKELSRGLEPQYIYTKTFGKTPEYLKRQMRKWETQAQRLKDFSGIDQPICRYITREERDELLEGLKQNWEELQQQYQGLPILTDTIPKQLKKSKLENDLKQLEKDIVLLERHPYIYVYDEDDLTNN